MTPALALMLAMDDRVTELPPGTERPFTESAAGFRRLLRELDGLVVRDRIEWLERVEQGLPATLPVSGRELLELERQWPAWTHPATGSVFFSLLTSFEDVGHELLFAVGDARGDRSIMERSLVGLTRCGLRGWSFVLKRIDRWTPAVVHAALIAAADRWLDIPWDRLPTSIVHATTTALTIARGDVVPRDAIGRALDDLLSRPLLAEHEVRWLVARLPTLSLEDVERIASHAHRFNVALTWPADPLPRASVLALLKTPTGARIAANLLLRECPERTIVYDAFWSPDAVSSGLGARLGRALAYMEPGRMYRAVHVLKFGKSLVDTVARLGRPRELAAAANFAAAPWHDGVRTAGEWARALPLSDLEWRAALVGRHELVIRRFLQSPPAVRPGRPTPATRREAAGAIVAALDGKRGSVRRRLRRYFDGEAGAPYQLAAYTVHSGSAATAEALVCAIAEHVEGTRPLGGYLLALPKNFLRPRRWSPFTPAGLLLETIRDPRNEDLACRVLRATTRRGLRGVLAGYAIDRIDPETLARLAREHPKLAMPAVRSLLARAPEHACAAIAALGWAARFEIFGHHPDLSAEEIVAACAAQPGLARLQVCALPVRNGGIRVHFRDWLVSELSSIRLPPGGSSTEVRILAWLIADPKTRWSRSDRDRARALLTRRRPDLRSLFDPSNRPGRSPGSAPATVDDLMALGRSLPGRNLRRRQWRRIAAVAGTDSPRGARVRAAIGALRTRRDLERLLALATRRPKTGRRRRPRFDPRAELTDFEAPDVEDEIETERAPSGGDEHTPPATSQPTVFRLPAGQRVAPSVTQRAIEPSGALSRGPLTSLRHAVLAAPVVHEVRAFLKDRDAHRKDAEALLDSGQVHPEWRPALALLAAGDSTAVKQTLRSPLGIRLLERRRPVRCDHVVIRGANRATAVGWGGWDRMDYPSFSIAVLPGLSTVTHAQGEDLDERVRRLEALRLGVGRGDTMTLAREVGFEDHPDLWEYVERAAVAYAHLRHEVLAEHPDARIKPRHVRRFYDRLETSPAPLSECATRWGADAVIEAQAFGLLAIARKSGPEGLRTLQARHVATEALRRCAVVFGARAYPSARAWLEPRPAVNALIHALHHAPVELAQALRMPPGEGLPRLDGGAPSSEERAISDALKSVMHGWTGVADDRPAIEYECRPLEKIEALFRGELGGDCSSDAVPLRCLSPHHTYYGIYRDGAQIRGYLTVFEAFAVLANRQAHPVLALETVNVPNGALDAGADDLLRVFERIAHSRGLAGLVVTLGGGTWNYNNANVLGAHRRLREGWPVQLVPADRGLWSAYRATEGEADYYCPLLDEASGYNGFSRWIAPFDPARDETLENNAPELARLAALPARPLHCWTTEEDGPAFISEWPDVKMRQHPDRI